MEMVTWQGAVGHCWDQWVTVSQQPTKIQGPQSHSYKYMNSANNLNQLGSTYFPNQASRWEHSLADILITDLWDWQAEF